MSDPLTELCEYCGSPNVMDDAGWCECQEAYEQECHDYLASMTVRPREVVARGWRYRRRLRPLVMRPRSRAVLDRYGLIVGLVVLERT